MLEDSQYWPKRVACVDESNKILLWLTMCVYRLLIQIVFVSQLSSNAGITIFDELCRLGQAAVS